MARRLYCQIVPMALGLTFLLGGCEGPTQAPPSKEVQAGAGAQSQPPPPPSNPKIKEIMARVGGPGPQSLQNSLVAAVKAEQPAWEEIQGGAKEYARLAAEMGGLEPIKGSSASWKELTKAFADSTADLDKAALAKEKDKVGETLAKLGGSCMGCHRQHRIMAPPGGRAASPGG
ncbi:cytochrome c [Aquisphaera giovannonii]|uniref:cytochrome c n=1 Tax=Aquisphaera giovannonii TaxID=406548 RepID=UPI0011DF8E30|nr:cytochrome c [Aquisphaera giovannonii]